MPLILFTHNLVINAVRQSNSVNTKSISTAINDRRSMCNSSSAAAGDGGENALGYSITGARRKCLYLHPIPVHCTPTYVTVCASVNASECVWEWCSRLKGENTHFTCAAIFSLTSIMQIVCMSKPIRIACQLMCAFFSLSLYPPLSLTLSHCLCALSYYANQEATMGTTLCR